MKGLNENQEIFAVNKNETWMISKVGDFNVTIWNGNWIVSKTGDLYEIIEMEFQLVREDKMGVIL